MSFGRTTRSYARRRWALAAAATLATTIILLPLLARGADEPGHGVEPASRPAGESPGVDEAARQTTRDERDRYRESVEALPKVDDKSHPFSDVFSLQVDADGRLVLCPGNIEPTPTHLRRAVTIDRVELPATLTYMAMVGRRMAVRYLRFELDVERFDENAGSSNRVRVYGFSRSLRMMQVIRSPDGSREVQLEDSGAESRLTVSGDGTEPIAVTEPTFALLRRRHPIEVAKWIRPMFRAVGQDRLFSPRLAIVWQVLSDAWPDDPSADAAVRRELPRFKSPDYRVRSAAADRVSALGAAGATAIAHLSSRGERMQLSPEQNLQLDSIIARWTPLPAAQAAELRDDPEFLLSCLDCSDPVARSVALQRLALHYPSLKNVEPADLDEPVVARLREKILTPATRPTQPSTDPAAWHSSPSGATAP